METNEKITRIVGVIYYNESNIYNPETSDSNFVKSSQDEYSFSLPIDEAEKRLTQIQTEYPEAYMITLYVGEPRENKKTTLKTL